MLSPTTILGYFPSPLSPSFNTFVLLLLPLPSSRPKSKKVRHSVSWRSIFSMLSFLPLYPLPEYPLPPQPQPVCLLTELFGLCLYLLLIEPLFKSIIHLTSPPSQFLPPPTEQIGAATEQKASSRKSFASKSEQKAPFSEFLAPLPELKAWVAE